jgi:hypothetical protein
MSTNSNNRPTKNTQLAQDQQMMAGLQKHGSTVPTWIIAGATYTAQQAAAVYQARIAAEQAVPPTKAAYSNAVQAARTEIANTAKLVSAIRQAVFIMFGSQADILADFGLTPRKARKSPSVVEKVQAVELRKATRVVRHTMAPSEKAKLHGVANVTISVSSPTSPTPAEPAPVALVTTPHGSTQGS